MNHAAAARREGDTIRSGIALAGRPEPVGALLARQVAQRPDHPVYRYRVGAEYRDESWMAFATRVARLAAHLEAAGVGPGDRVAVVSPNRAEMLVAEFATMGMGAVHVPIFAGYAPEQISDLLDQADPAAVLIGEPALIPRLRLPAPVRVTIVFDEPDRPLPGVVGLAGILGDRHGSPDPVARFLEAAGGRNPHDPCLMMFTSGTSGRLKGVVLTHDNILSQQRALSLLWNLGPRDRLLSYLPWHHSFGGIFEKYAALWNAAPLALDDSLGKDIDRLIANWELIRPTIYFSVPKISQQLVACAETSPGAADRILHPELRFVFSAAAPLPERIGGFLADRGIPVLEGWGLTETSPCCTVTDLTAPRTVPGLVGYPIPGVMLKVAPDGEILVRGPNVMQGYFRDPEATAGAISPDGWFHTGDLGELVGAGLRLLARKDRVFKLLNAEKVIPTAIENQLAADNPYIRHVIVAGAGQPSLIAVVFPDYFRIDEEFGADRERAEREVSASLRETVLAFNQDHPVRYERIRALVVIGRELTVERGELTPSLKVRVHQVLADAGPFLEAAWDPSAACECRYLRQVMRLLPDDRPCVAGLDRTLDQCHCCGDFIFGTSGVELVSHQPGGPA